MNAIDIVVAKWNESQLDFFITAAMPFFVLAGLWLLCFLRRVRLPRAFYPLSVFCSLVSLVYAPVCGCVDTEQTISTAVIALMVNAAFFGPVALGYTLLSLRRTS